jgi:hypothetical protein
MTARHRDCRTVRRVGQDRKRYDTWPDYLKHTIFHPPTVTQYRVSARHDALPVCLVLALRVRTCNRGAVGL